MTDCRSAAHVTTGPTRRRIPPHQTAEPRTCRRTPPRRSPATTTTASPRSRGAWTTVNNPARHRTPAPQPNSSTQHADHKRRRPTPLHLEASNANLVGAVGGTAQLSQQLIFRPVTGLGDPRTPIEGLHLGSAAIHPGGAVHRSCGHLAGRQASADPPVAGRRRPGAPASRAVWPSTTRVTHCRGRLPRRMSLVQRPPSPQQ